MASSSTAIAPGRKAGPRVETLLADLGIDPERFRAEFIYDIFVKQVMMGHVAARGAGPRPARLGSRAVDGLCRLLAQP